MRLQLWSHLTGVGWGELSRVGITASLFFLLIGSNNLLKILRDSIFLGHHSIRELSYLYILIAVVAGGVIAIYTRYTRNIAIVRLMLATNTFIALTLVFFWFVLTYVDAGWSHYAFYIWSAMAGLIALAQAWTFVSELFTRTEGQRLFGLLAAGGTLGGAAAAFGAKWAIESSLEANHLLWIAGACFLAASVLVLWGEGRLRKIKDGTELAEHQHAEYEKADGVGSLLGRSRYAQVIAVLILVSVVVSTLIDFEFKAAAKQAHLSKDALAVFFSTYYGWLSVVTFFAQSVLTARAFAIFGFFPSLFLTPAVLLSGTTSMLLWPGLTAASLTRMADAVLRQSIHRSGIEILYMPLPAGMRRTVKTFLDVVVERAGDATAGFIILLATFWSADMAITNVHILCVGLILAWMLLIPLLRTNGYDTATTDKPSSGVRKSETTVALNSQIWQEPDKIS
jgi:ATP:ADP antiporter, AAA family